MKQIEMAKKLGVSPAYISKWVTGRSRIPGIHALKLSDISKKFGFLRTTTNKILDLSGEDLKRLINQIPNVED